MSIDITQADLQAALPDVTSPMILPGLRAPVDIYRDQWGIPHIRAQNEQDAFFAQGFATAQDRLWHMDYDRHRALGRWAEFAGPGGLSDDRLMRRFRLEAASQADYEVSSPESRRMLDAYADGVNAFLSTTKSLPVEHRILGATPEPWLPWHCIAVYKVRNMLMGTYEMKLWRARLAIGLGPERAAALFTGIPRGSLVTVPPGAKYDGPPADCLKELAEASAELNWLGEVDGGSNAWVISGERTASGLPLVAGDSHRALDTPSVYYQVHLSCPEFSVSGYSVPGVPGAPHFSHTQHLAWGMTHGNADYQDLFTERFRESDGRLEYEHMGQWEAAQVFEETLHIRDSEPEPLSVIVTRHGPIIAGDPRDGTGLAFSHTGTNSGTAWPDTVYRLLHATSADEGEEALREWTEPVNNFVYADTQGNFGYRYRGRIPMRSGANAWRPVPGWTGTHEWAGNIPFEDMPQARNPEQGWVVTCNQAVTTADYPFYINAYSGPDFRARRITARLARLPPGSATVADMSSIHADRLSIPAQALVDALRDVEPRDPRVAAAKKLLVGWDFSMDRDSEAATIYAATRSRLLGKIIDAAFGPMAEEAAGVCGTGRGAPAHAAQVCWQAINAMFAGDTSPLPEGRTWRDMVLAALQEAVTELRERLGDGPLQDGAAAHGPGGWEWGRVHHTRPRHPLSVPFPEVAALLDPPRMAAGGDGDTPQQGGYLASDPFVLTSMSVNRYIHDPSNWSNSRWIVPLGASGHPGSPHYADQALLWADVQTVPQLWDWAEIEAAAETTQRLRPADAPDAPEPAGADETPGT